MKKYMNKRVLDAQLSGIRTFNQRAMSIKDSLLLTLGEPDFPTPEEIKLEVNKALDKDMTHYAQTIGNIDLVEKISLYEKEYNNVSYDLNEIIVTNGSTEAITASLFSVINEGDEVIIPIPAFGLYESSLKLAGAKYVPLDTSINNFQISKEMLDNVITDKTKAIVITSPNNPTGTIYTYETLKNIYNAVKDKPIFVICDDCYEQLVYQERVPSFSNFKEIKNQIIVTKSFSKSYAMTGWRVGYILACKEVIEEIVKYHQFMVTTVNTFIQPACIKALDYNPSSMVLSYKDRRDYVYKRLVDMGFDVVKPEGAFYIFPSIKKFNMSSYDFCLNLLNKYHVALIPGIYFGVEGYIRISYCVKMDVIEEALNRLEKFIKEL